jgi:hypothetical protein
VDKCRTTRAWSTDSAAVRVLVVPVLADLTPDVGGTGVTRVARRGHPPGARPIAGAHRVLVTAPVIVVGAVIVVRAVFVA